MSIFQNIFIYIAIHVLKGERDWAFHSWGSQESFAVFLQKDLAFIFENHA